MFGFFTKKPKEQKDPEWHLIYLEFVPKDEFPDWLEGPFRPGFELHVQITDWQVKVGGRFFEAHELPPVIRQEVIRLCLRGKEIMDAKEAAKEAEQAAIDREHKERLNEIERSIIASRRLCAVRDRG